ncbi:MAG: murein biosynthesis integral membrane protein MurJ, partial [Alphaproteobacteria bacterium]|nr:murein biosynthesis integral membrane protein MurJ [Alphaproteobacteria bacterium]
MSLIKNSAIIGGLTLVSRVLGLVRDLLTARYLGVGMANDAFQVAWRLPNLFRALFAEGAFASAFVPMFNRTIAEAEGEGRDGLAAAVTFASHVFAVLLPILILFTVLMMVFAGPIVFALAPGFANSGPEKLRLARILTTITIPYLGLISLVSLFGGILNSINRFWVNAAAPILLNLCMIIAIMFFRGHNDPDIAKTQAIAVTVSGAVQLGWLVWSCQRNGIVLHIFRPRLSPDVRKMLLLIGPAALGQGAVQLNQVVSMYLASSLPQGALSYLYFADRLNQLPLGLIGIGVGTAILPGLSRDIGSGNVTQAQYTQNRAIELAFLLAMPAAVALVLSSVPITRAVFQTGRFHAENTIICASVLSAFSIAVPAYVLIKILTPGYYARQDTKTPVRIAVMSMLVNLLGNLILIGPLQIVGVAV